MIIETDLELAGGRVLHVYDSGDDGGRARLAVVWHHGTPNTGDPPEPLFAAAAGHGVRWVSYDRPSYGTSTARPGRDIASAAEDVAAVTRALGIERYAVMGHSGGSTHALASAALTPERVLAAVCVAGLAPHGAEGLDYFAGMAPAEVAVLRASLQGRAVVEEHVASTAFDPEQFTAADHAVLGGPWSWLGRVAGKAGRGGDEGLVDDELSYVAPWGFDVAAVRAPLLLVYGDEDRITPLAHGEWLARRAPGAELWARAGDGHLSVLSAGEAALDWLVRHS